MNTRAKRERYFIANRDNIPYHAQPENGYTKLQVIARIHRESRTDADLFGGNYTDYIHDYRVLTNTFHDVTDNFYNLV